MPNLPNNVVYPWIYYILFIGFVFDLFMNTSFFFFLFRRQLNRFGDCVFDIFLEYLTACFFSSPMFVASFSIFKNKIVGFKWKHNFTKTEFVFTTQTVFGFLWSKIIIHHTLRKYFATSSKQIKQSIGRSNGHAGSYAEGSSLS